MTLVTYNYVIVFVGESTFYLYSQLMSMIPCGFIFFLIEDEQSLCMHWHIFV